MLSFGDIMGQSRKFWKKVRTLGDWVRGTLVFQLLEKNITVRLILLRQAEKILKQKVKSKRNMSSLQSDPRTRKDCNNSVLAKANLL